jgi:hypothetical protein
MPQPPKPNAGRAVIGFVIGLVIGLVVVGMVRFIQGLDVFAIAALDFLFAGNFWDDEATFMFAMLFGALGFVWGAGALYDFSKEAEQSRAIQPRIPIDPDAPKVNTSPVMALLGAFPSMGTSIAVMVLAAVILVLIPLSGLGGTQTSDPVADPTKFGNSDYNLVGLIKLENASEATLFAVFAAVVIGATFLMGAGLAMLFWLLNRQIKVATEIKPEPTEGEAFLPIRLAAFFTDWVLDILDGVKGIVTPR